MTPWQQAIVARAEHICLLRANAPVRGYTTKHTRLLALVAVSVWKDARVESAELAARVKTLLQANSRA